MAATLAFDVYGTLIDTNGIKNLLERRVGALAPTFMNLWRSKQLEYTFRRSLMQKYVNFSVCTRNALDFTCLQLSTNLTEEEKNELLHEYTILPPFADVKESLTRLKAAGFRLFAFSNGEESEVRNLLQNAGIDSLFKGIISVDNINTFKPNPEVYEYFLQKSYSTKNKTWLISSNPFDVIGAISVGMRSVWVQRSTNVIFDPLEIQPTKVISDFANLIGILD